MASLLRGILFNRARSRGECENANTQASYTHWSKVADYINSIHGTSYDGSQAKTYYNNTLRRSLLDHLAAMRRTGGPAGTDEIVGLGEEIIGKHQGLDVHRGMDGCEYVVMGRLRKEGDADGEASGARVIMLKTALTLPKEVVELGDKVLKGTLRYEWSAIGSILGDDADGMLEADPRRVVAEGVGDAGGSAAQAVAAAATAGVDVRLGDDSMGAPAPDAAAAGAAAGPRGTPETPPMRSPQSPGDGGLVTSPVQYAVAGGDSGAFVTPAAQRGRGNGGPPRGGSSRPRSDLEAQMVRLTALVASREEYRRDKARQAAELMGTQPASDAAAAVATVPASRRLTLRSVAGAEVTNLCISAETRTSEILTQVPADVELVTADGAVIPPTERILPHAATHGYVTIRRKPVINWNDHLDVVFNSPDSEIDPPSSP